MQVNGSTALSIPQADGDVRPFHRPVNGPIRVQVSGPAFKARDPFVLTIQQRDAKLAHLIEPMKQLLFLAMKAHALGVVEAETIEQLPARVQQQLEADAWAAVNRQSNLYRAEADRQASTILSGALRDLTFHFPYHNPVASPEAVNMRRDAIASVKSILESQRIDTLIVSEVERCYSQPLSSSPRSQVVRTAMAGVR